MHILRLMQDRFRDHMANERTLLAWLRTAVALMGFGFVLARFGYLFFEAGVHGAGFGQAGSAVAMAGVGVALLATIRFLRQRRALLRGDAAPSPFTPVALGLGLVLLGAYLSWLLLRQPTGAP